MGKTVAIDTEVPPELEYDDGSLTIRWSAPDHSESFSVVIHDGSIIGVHCDVAPSKAKAWKVELPAGFVRVDHTVIEKGTEPMPELKAWPPEDPIDIDSVSFVDLPKWTGPDMIRGTSGSPYISVSGLYARYLKDAMDKGHRLRVKSDGKTYRIKACGIFTSGGISDFVLEEVADDAIG